MSEDFDPMAGARFYDAALRINGRLRVLLAEFAVADPVRRQQILTEQSDLLAELQRHQERFDAFVRHLEEWQSPPSPEEGQP